jgi:hypothetical protein
MPDKIDKSLLQQRWLHSREEDSATQMVFRPDTYELPPARGRTGFELAPGGDMVTLGIGPTDRRAVGEGTWKLEGGDTLVLYESPGAPTRRLKILSLDKDRMVVAKE